MSGDFCCGAEWGTIAPKTVGYRIYGKLCREYFGWRAIGEGLSFIGTTPADFPSIESALQAVNESPPLGPIALHKIVETTVTETKTEYVPLV